MAHRKSGGSASSFGSSNPKYRGVKKNNNQSVKKGQILIRQKGTKYHYGENVGCGKDHTLFALKDGTLVFTKKRVVSFTGKVKRMPCVSIQ